MKLSHPTALRKGRPATQPEQRQRPRLSTPGTRLPDLRATWVTAYKLRLPWQRGGRSSSHGSQLEDWPAEGLTERLSSGCHFLPRPTPDASAPSWPQGRRCSLGEGRSFPHPCGPESPGKRSRPVPAASLALCSLSFLRKCVTKSWQAALLGSRGDDLWGDTSTVPFRLGRASGWVPRSCCTFKNSTTLGVSPMSLCLHRALEVLRQGKNSMGSGRELHFLGLLDTSVQMTVVPATR